MAAPTSDMTATELPAAMPGPGGVDRAGGLGVAVALVLIGAAEAVAIAVLLSQSGSVWGALVVVHVAALAALGLVFGLAWRAGRDASMPVLGLVAGTVIGPIGILGAAMLGFAGLVARKPNPLIAAWYERIALSTAAA